MPFMAAIATRTTSSRAFVGNVPLRTSAFARVATPRLVEYSIWKRLALWQPVDLIWSGQSRTRPCVPDVQDRHWGRRTRLP